MSTPLVTVIATIVAALLMAVYAIGISNWHDRQDKKRAQKHAH